MTEPIQTQRKPWWKRWWVIAIGVLIVIGVIANIGSSSEKSADSVDQSVEATSGNGTSDSPAASNPPATNGAGRPAEGPFDAIEEGFGGERTSIGSFTLQKRSCGFVDGDSCFYVRITLTRDCVDGLTFDAPAVIAGTPVDNVSDLTDGGYSGQEVTLKVSAKDKGATLDPARATWTCVNF